jgi:hypothetical protein
MPGNATQIYSTNQIRRAIMARQRQIGADGRPVAATLSDTRGRHGSLPQCLSNHENVRPCECP